MSKYILDNDGDFMTSGGLDFVIGRSIDNLPTDSMFIYPGYCPTQLIVCDYDANTGVWDEALAGVVPALWQEPL